MSTCGGARSGSRTPTWASGSTRRGSSRCCSSGSKASADRRAWCRGVEVRAMASRKRPARLRPKTPSRVKKRKRKTKRARGHQHPELVGLWLAALGLFLASVVYVGWNGGYVGAALADALEAVIGHATWGVPVLLLGVGGL